MSYLGNPYTAQNIMSGYGYNRAQVAILNRSQALRGRATTDSQFRRIGRAAENMHRAASNRAQGLSNG